MRFDTASAVACSCVSSTVIRPIGLSSRTISPVSVTHDVVVMPAERHLDLERRDRPSPPAVTTSRAPIAIVTGAFFIVAGSNTVHCARGAGRQALAGQPAADAQHQRRRLGQLARFGARAAAAA